jgi:hypothetical protein
MKIPIYIGLDNKKTFRSYTQLADGSGHRHRSKGMKGPAKMFEAPDAVLPERGRNGELVLMFADRSIKTAEQCWEHAIEFSPAQL